MNLWDAHKALHTEGLVRWSQGNASVRAGDYLHIKPSGAECSKPIDDFAFVRLSDGEHDVAPVPSTDFEAHRYIYNHLPDIHAVVHTHSTYASAFAVAHRPIPCCMTMMADEFGGDVPVSRVCEIGNEAIGAEVVRLYKMTGRPAMLIAAHGVFTLGKTIDAAVKAAVITEEAAKVAFLAARMGNVYTLPQADIDANFKRYQSTYGQP